MGIWLELGIFGLVFVFAFWQMHDVRKAQEQTRRQRALEKAQAQAHEQAAMAPTDPPAPAQPAQTTQQPSGRQGSTSV